MHNKRMKWCNILSIIHICCLHPPCAHDLGTSPSQKFVSIPTLSANHHKFKSVLTVLHILFVHVVTVALIAATTLIISLTVVEIEKLKNHSCKCYRYTGTAVSWLCDCQKYSVPQKLY